MSVTIYQCLVTHFRRNLGSRGIGVITGADGIKPGVGSETNFRRTLFAPFYIRSSAGARLRRLAREFMRHTPASRNSSPRSGFCLSSATRPSEFLTRGFASQSHGWFALSKSSKKMAVAAVQTATAMPLCAYFAYLVCFGCDSCKKRSSPEPGPKRINER